MDLLDTVITEIDYILDSRRKRHIIGGLLVSLALMCGGLAVTVGTLKEDEDEERGILLSAQAHDDPDHDLQEAEDGS